jgi:hypothetical protein
MADSNKNTGISTQSNQGQANQGQGNQGQATTAGVAQMARDAASSVSHAAAEQAKQAASTVAGGMHSLAGSIREHAPSQGMIGNAAGSVADSLDSGSRYLQQEGFGGLVDDVANTVRRNPISCVLCCVGVGFLLGWALSPSHSNPRSN